MIDKNKTPSPLVQSVTALDGFFSDLVRIGGKIENMELESDFDVEQMQKLLNRFAETSEEVSAQNLLMSQALTEARANAEKAAQIVSTRAEISVRFSELRGELVPLIAEARQLKLEGKLSKMKILEQGADSLGQSLVAIQQKIAEVVTI